MTNERMTFRIQSLIDAFIAGDNKQFHIIRSQISKYVNSHRELSRDLKEDVIADTIAALLQNFRTRKFRGDSLKALNVYIFRIVRNTIFNYRRKLQRDYSRNGASNQFDRHSTSPEIGMANKELISKVLTQIEEKCAALLKMKFHLGMSNQEIAERFGMTLNATSTAISRCLDRVKNLGIIKELV